MPLKKKDNQNSNKSGVRRTDVSTALVSRTMPESLEAEAAVLGSMILDPQCIGAVVQKLTSAAFYRVEHQMIFEAMISLWDKKSDVFDLLLLRMSLKTVNSFRKSAGRNI